MYKLRQLFVLLRPDGLSHDGELPCRLDHLFFSRFFVCVVAYIVGECLLVPAGRCQDIVHLLLVCRVLKIIFSFTRLSFQVSHFLLDLINVFLATPNDKILFLLPRS